MSSSVAATAAAAAEAGPLQAPPSTDAAGPSQVPPSTDTPLEAPRPKLTDDLYELTTCEITYSSKWLKGNAAIKAGRSSKPRRINRVDRALEKLHKKPIIIDDLVMVQKKHEQRNRDVQRTIASLLYAWGDKEKIILVNDRKNFGKSLFVKFYITSDTKLLSSVLARSNQGQVKRIKYEVERPEWYQDEKEKNDKFKFDLYGSDSESDEELDILEPIRQFYKEEDKSIGEHDDDDDDDDNGCDCAEDDSDCPHDDAENPEYFQQDLKSNSRWSLEAIWKKKVVVLEFKHRVLDLEFTEVRTFSRTEMGRGSYARHIDASDSCCIAEEGSIIDFKPGPVVQRHYNHEATPVGDGSSMITGHYLSVSFNLDEKFLVPLKAEPAHETKQKVEGFYDGQEQSFQFDN